MLSLKQLTIDLDYLYKEIHECTICFHGTHCVVHAEKLCSCINGIRNFKKSLAGKPENSTGHGMCTDCTWLNIQEGCNVDRDSEQCKINKRPI